MKTLALYFPCFIVCACLSGIVLYYAIGVVGRWYEPRFVTSDSDLGDEYVVALSVQVLSFPLGGGIGCLVLRRWLRDPARRAA